jgi:DNA-binding MarR family transcriptional regulator
MQSLADKRKLSDLNSGAKKVKLTLVSGGEPRATSADQVIDFGPLNNRLGHILRRAQLAVFSDFFEAFSEYGIKPAQYSCLTIIDCNPGLRQSQVAEALGIKKPNFVAMVQILEARGLVRRATTRNDKRSNALYLTKTGQELIGELHQIGEEHERKISNLIGNKAYEGLFEPLRKIGMTAKSLELE